MAKYETENCWCQHCQTNVEAKKRIPNHLLHFGISILTGFWLVVWLYLAANEDKKTWICTNCQNKINPAKEINDGM
jgi:hypothetical protein